MNQSEITCCFTGHRVLPEEKIEQIKERLDREVDILAAQGVTNFISGGALGFDQMAASVIIAKKHAGKNVRLLFALPCKNQDKYWSPDQRRYYRRLLVEADEIVNVSENYTDGCMEKRNRYMVDRSAFCICACSFWRSGTGQTVRYAKQNGLTIINVTG